MRYWKVESGNGLCGCDDEWLMEQNDEPSMGDIMECYTYATGYAGQENYISDYDDEEEYWEDYETDIMENTSYEEITEEEFIELRDEEGWEVR